MKMRTQLQIYGKQQKQSVLRGKFIALQSYLKKKEYQINNLSLYLKEVEKEK